MARASLNLSNLSIDKIVSKFKTSFVRDAFALSAATGVAQLVTLGMLPVLTRLYSPEAFGMLALYLAIFTYMNQLATMNLEQAVVLPATTRGSQGIVSALLLIALTVSLIGLVVAFVARDYVAIELLGQPVMSSWLLLLPVTVLGMSTYLGFRFFLLRERRFKSIGMAYLTGVCVGSAASVLAGWLLPEPFQRGGLILGYTIQTYTFMLVVLYCTSDFRTGWFKGGLSAIREAVRPYHKLIASTTTSRLISISYARLPVFFLNFVFGPAVLGLFSLAERIAGAPRTLLAGPIGDVYRQRAASQWNEKGRFDGVFLRTLALTAGIGIPFHLVLIFMAEPFFGFVLGPKWIEAGRYASIILVGSLFAFIATPLDKGPAIRQKHAYLIGWPTVRLILKIIGFSAAYFWLGTSIETVLWILVAVRVVMHVADLYCEYIWSCGKDVIPVMRSQIFRFTSRN